jgi:hypothetical protein
MRILAFAPLAAFLLASIPHEAEADRYRARHGGKSSVGVVVYPQGLYIGAGAVGTRILSQQGGPELLDDGAGLSLYSGLRVSPNLALELGLMTTLHNPEDVATPFGRDVDYLVLSGLTADAKIYFQTRSPGVEPFVQGGLGVYFLDSQHFGAQSVGSGFQAGGGVDFRLSPHVDLGVRGLYRGLAMGPPAAGFDDTFVSAMTAEANLTIRF